MEIIEKLKCSNKDDIKPVTLAFTGDSVTEGCFECYLNENKQLLARVDSSKSYPTRVGEMLEKLYPNANFKIVNAGVGGDNARRGNIRFEKDVAAHFPDLCVVSFGLNDATAGIDKLNEYLGYLKSLFDKVKETGAECIFLTENILCTKVSPNSPNEETKILAERFMVIQNNGVLKQYFKSAIELAKSYGYHICDIYSVWDKMIENGVDVTELLVNYLNHPGPDMHYYIAIKLIETMLEI